MELPLNEWDVALRPGAFTSCKSWHDFVELMDTLANEYDVQKVLFPKDEASILHKEIHELKPDNVRLKIKCFYDRFVKNIRIHLNIKNISAGMKKQKMILLFC